MTHTQSWYAVALTAGLAAAPSGAQVTTAAALVTAVDLGAEGSTVLVATGTFELTAALRPKRGMRIQGAGMGRTIITNRPTFAPGTTGLSNDEGATLAAIDCSKYLINLGRDTGNDITLTDLTLTGPQVHGGVCGIAISRLTLSRVEFRNFLWAGARLFISEGGRFNDNVFHNAGGRAAITTGSSGGALFLTYVSATTIWNNRFTRDRGNDGYGIKGREARNVHIYDNTIDVFFSIELPFEFDYDVEIDHNYLGGAISVPKFAGAPGPPDGGLSFWVHHNYFNTSYSFEYQRNSVKIDHNLFDFPLDGDDGNLISSFDAAPATLGGTAMHDNLISNPGRGLYWNEGVYNNFNFYNNHVRGQTTLTPRTEGLFDFRPNRNGAQTTWSSIRIRDNIFELTGTRRPLLRNSESAQAVIENNQLSGISNTSAYGNPAAARPRGPTSPLCYRVGADQEWTVDGWSHFRTPRPTPTSACGTQATLDGGAPDGGATLDGGSRDAGVSVEPDAGLNDSDAGALRPDAGPAPNDGGTAPLAPATGCGCTSSEAAVLSLLLSLARRGPRRR